MGTMKIVLKNEKRIFEGRRKRMKKCEVWRKEEKNEKWDFLRTEKKNENVYRTQENKTSGLKAGEKKWKNGGLKEWRKE